MAGGGGRARGAKGNGRGRGGGFGEGARIAPHPPRVPRHPLPAQTRRRVHGSMQDGRRARPEPTRPTGHVPGPRLVYTSSIAVFGAPFPASIPDDFHLTPLTSYGTQKAIGEALIADYTRRGFCDGVGIRLPSVVVRPGKPNKAASGFFSGIIREPLAGLEAVLPVPDTVVHTL